MRTRAAQFSQPLRWILLQFHKFLVGQRGALELLWRSGKVNPKLLSGSLGLHRAPRRYRFFIHTPNGSITTMLHLAFVLGTEPDKWIHRYQDRTSHGITAIASPDPFDQAELTLMRLPDPRVDPEIFHIVHLYEEQPGVALPKDHTLTLHDVVPSEELSSEIVNFRAGVPVDIQGLRDALQVVAANVGIAYAPRPLLKALCGKQIEHRGVESSEQTQIALVWRKNADNEEIQDFVGICRGRTLNSSRSGASASQKPAKKPAKKAAKQSVKKQGQKKSGQKQSLSKKSQKKAGRPARKVKRRR